MSDLFYQFMAAAISIVMVIAAVFLARFVSKSFSRNLIGLLVSAAVGLFALYFANAFLLTFGLIFAGAAAPGVDALDAWYWDYAMMAWVAIYAISIVVFAIRNWGKA